MTRPLRYERHAYSAAWPDPSEASYRGLVESISRIGLRSPIVLFEGRVLDGWHRQMGCVLAGVEPRYVQFEGDADQAYDHVEAAHTHRDMTPGQYVAALLAMNAVRAGAGRPGNSANLQNLTAAQVAERAGTSVRTVETVKKIERVAPEQMERVRAGEAPSKVLREATRAKNTPPASPSAPAPAKSAGAGKKAKDPNQMIAEQTAEIGRLNGLLAELQDERDEARQEAARLHTQVQAAEAVLAGEHAKRILQLEAELDSTRRTRDDALNKAAETLKQVKILQKQLGRK